MNKHQGRRAIVVGLLTSVIVMGLDYPGVVMAKDSDQTPALRRIKMATVATPDLVRMEDWYIRWLGYQVAERGSVDAALAASWGAPQSAGRAYILMAPENGGDVFIRGVEIDPMPEYRAMTTFGWNSIEIIVDDVYALSEQLEGSPFEVIGEPHSLGGGFASIHAMQVVGPGQEVLYLTCETGDREKSTLPIPQSFVDRPFIMILAGPDLEAMADFYVSKFKMGRIPNFETSLPIVGKVLGVDPEYRFTLGLLRGAERGNNIELDQYPSAAKVRLRPDGQLPPGVAMTSFAVEDLDALEIDYIKPPARHYGAIRSASFVGPAGEVTELIEEP